MRGIWLRHLGFLGLLGLLGLVTSNPGFAGFLGFLGFFGYQGSTSDERLETNVNRAARNAFVTTVLVYALAIVAYSLFAPSNSQVTAQILVVAFALSFGLSMLVFTVSLVYYEREGGSF
jgi:hypothetical protein